MSSTFGVPSMDTISSIYSVEFFPGNKTFLPNNSAKMQPIDQMSIERSYESHSRSTSGGL